MTTINPIDQAMVKQPDQRTEHDWALIRGVVVKCLSKIMTNKYSGKDAISNVIKQSIDDIAQNILIQLLNEDNRFDLDKSPLSYIPRCWGHVTTRCMWGINDMISYHTAQKRDVELLTWDYLVSEDNFGEPELIELAEKDPTDYQYLIDRINQKMSKYERKGLMTAKIYIKAQIELAELNIRMQNDTILPKI